MSGEIIRLGTIEAVCADRLGRLFGTILIRDSQTGDIEEIPCVTDLVTEIFEKAYGRVTGPGGRIDNDGGAHVGKEIYWGVDQSGIFSWFTPEEEAPDPLLRAYRLQYN